MQALIFGFGYVGKAFANELGADWRIAATVRQPIDRAAAELQDVTAIDPADAPSLLALVASADAILVTSPPDENGCPALSALRPGLIASSPHEKWIGYLSTTGVYGDTGGAWVNEASRLAPLSEVAIRRVAAEAAWLEFGRVTGAKVVIFRLPGIYGPGKSVFDRIRNGTSRRIVKPGHVFSRVHVDDIVSGLRLSLAKRGPGTVYNLCDDEPASASDVIAYAEQLLGAPPSPEMIFDPATIPKSAARFYLECRRVDNTSARRELGWQPTYKNYREGLLAILAAGG